MPAKANPKAVTSSELLAENEKLINLAHRLLVNKQVTMEVYKVIISASNTFIDLYISQEHPSNDNKDAK